MALLNTDGDAFEHLRLIRPRKLWKTRTTLAGLSPRAFLACSAAALPAAAASASVLRPDPAARSAQAGAASTTANPHAARKVTIPRIRSLLRSRGGKDRSHPRVILRESPWKMQGGLTCPPHSDMSYGQIRPIRPIRPIRGIVP